MNVITQQNQQAMLHDHYNQANQAFQDGNYGQALKELEQALQYAETEKQVAHIQQSIRTVQEMMPQEPNPGPSQGQPQSQEVSGGEDTPPGSNRMLLLTVLVGLICLTPIVMKCIEIFTQPSIKTEQVQQTTQTTQQSTQTTDQASASAPASPVSTPEVIVEAGAAAKWVVTGNGINMRASASTKAAPLAKLSAGESVKMLEANAQQANGYIWSKVETTTGVTGWVATQFLREEQPAAAPVAPVTDPASPVDATSAVPADTASADTMAASVGTPRNLSTGGVSLRGQPGTKATLITVLSQSQVTVLPDAPIQADGFNWVKVKTAQGTEGWIADKFLSP